MSYQGHGLQSASSAYRIPDGQVVLLTHLQEGQRATVLQLPAQVKRAGAEHPALPEAGHVLDRQRDPPGRLNLHEGKIPVPVAGTAPAAGAGRRSAYKSGIPQSVSSALSAMAFAKAIRSALVTEMQTDLGTQGDAATMGPARTPDPRRA